MLRITPNTTPAGAKSYYTTADYYVEGQELAGMWRGDAAKRLGLSGKVERSDWDALCDNLNPATREALTPRRRADRRVGYDFNFHVPKSVSLLYGLTQDERILDAFRVSVDETMQDMEAEMQTRVRSNGRNEDRTTGNMVWGEFIHFTARPVDGVPDPHVHAHCFVFNATWDREESRWKAGQFAGIKRDAPYFEAMFHSRLARRLQELGLPTERTRTGWEIAGVPDAAIQRFSRRTAVIEDAAREAGITDPDARGELGAKTRERKAKDLTLGELRDEWRSRLTPAEAVMISLTADRLGDRALRERPEAARDGVEQAVSHCFERSAVVPERRLLAEAMKRSVGDASPGMVADAMATQSLIIAERGGRRLATTREVLDEESRMVAFARNGRGSCRPLAPQQVIQRDWLNDAQKSAVNHVLVSRDRVVVVRGAAGTGKTSMMQEAVEGIEAAGTRVFTFAPSADASRGVLRQEGFKSADTVSRLLVDERLQAEVRGQVMWIDEAGLLSSRAMAEVFDLAARLDARVVLSGDRRQHGSVERGAALRLLEEEAGIRPAELRDIQRQRGAYKAAVAALGDGRIDEGFRRLDELGWIREVEDAERYELLARDYLATVEQGKTALVVSPTHLEGEWITDEIRTRLREAGKLRGRDHHFANLESVNLTEAERRDALSYSPGDVLVFHQNAKGHRKGDRVTVGDEPLPLEQAASFQLFRTGMLELAAGDRVRITRNGMTQDGKHRLNNGAIYEVSRFDRDGNIVLNNGWVVSKDYGHLAHGYCTTSHASQGKTVDRVLIGQSAESFPASSREQFYVSVSRGREQATIYTDDREALLAAVDRADERMTATELAAERARELVRSQPATPVQAASREDMSHER